MKVHLNLTLWFKHLCQLILFCLFYFDSISVSSENWMRLITYVCWEFVSVCMTVLFLFVCAFHVSLCLSWCWCCCPLFCFILVWPALIVYLSNHAVLLVAVFLHKSPFPPYQRGFFCNDDSIRLPSKSSTVSNTVLTAVGVTVPVASVSPGLVQRENQGAFAGTLSIHPMVGLRHLGSSDWFDRIWLARSDAYMVYLTCCKSRVLHIVCQPFPKHIFVSFSLIFVPFIILGL